MSASSSAVMPQSVNARIEARRPSSEHFQNDVHASIARRLQNLVLISGFAMIENLMRSLALGNFEAFRRPCSTQNRQTHGARDLQRRGTDTATCAVHQYSLSSVGFRRVIERVICGSIGNPDSCTLLQINVRWKRMHLFFLSERIFRVRTTDSSRRVYAVSLLYLLDALADRFNSSGTIRSRSVGSGGFTA
jgi:hypothetical protein